ncbi:MAG: LPS assembly protein LptD [Candidatus Binatia bacterium]|nr:LPS assembly protein LptD [Candidatus Binatia bacterium]
MCARVGLAVAIWLGVASALASLGRAQELPSNLPVQVEADALTYNRERDLVTASGNVVIRYGDVELRAERVEVERSTSVVSAEGEVRLDSPEGVLFADRARIDLEQEVGNLRGAAIRSRKLQYSLWGSSIEKFAGQRYRIVNGRFTTCNCEEGRQSWSIAAKELDVTVDGYAVARGATFNILDVPVVYLPRALFPVQRERQSGFLMPRFGASNQRGFQTIVPFYWAIDPTREASLALDVETSARVGALAEYRYRASLVDQGSLAASYFNEFLRGDRTRGTMTVPQDRWSVLSSIDQHMGESVQLYIEGNLISDDQFFREMNTYSFEHRQTVLFRTLPYTASHAGAAYSLGRSLLALNASYYQDLTDPLESRTVQVAPRLAWLGQAPLQKWLLADWRLDWTQFERAQGPAGARLFAQPRISATIPLAPWGYGSVSVRFWQNAYALHRTEPLTAAGVVESLPSYSHREQVEVRAEAGSELQRVYDFPHWGMDRIKHTIEPVAQYYFVPRVSQEDLPFFDVFDRVNRRNVVAFGMISRLLGRFPASAPSDSGSSEKTTTTRELARFSLLQAYDLDRVIPPLTQRLGESHLSDVDLQGRINPSRFFSFRFAGTFDPQAVEFSSTQVGVFAEDPREVDSAAGRRLATRTSAGIAYRLLANNVLQQIDGNFVVRLTDWAGVTYATRYNVPAGRFLENYFGLRFVSLCDCWSVDIAMSNRTNPNETEARLQVTLIGLSSVRQASRVALAP